MPKFTYNRDTVPIGETIRLEVQFQDSAGNPKDTDSAFPSIAIFDGYGVQATITSSNFIRRAGIGHYFLDYLVPDGYTVGQWNDVWTGIVDGATLRAVFNFTVNSIGEINAIGSVVDPIIQIGDEPLLILDTYSETAKANINVLLKLLKAKLRSTAFKPDGTKCNVFDNDDLLQFLIASLSEFNATPTITGYDFDNTLIRTLFSDVITQGAMLIAWAGQAILEAGKEWTINDNGVQVNPPPVSSTISGMYNSQLTDYRAKLKEIKRNHRPAPLGMGAGNLLVNNPALRRLRHRRENQII